MPVMRGAARWRPESWPLVGSQPSQTPKQQLQDQRGPERGQRRRRRRRACAWRGRTRPRAGRPPACRVGRRPTTEKRHGQQHQFHGRGEVAGEVVGDLSPVWIERPRLSLEQVGRSGRTAAAAAGRGRIRGGPSRSCRAVASGPAASAAGSAGATLRDDEGDQHQPRQREQQDRHEPAQPRRPQAGHGFQERRLHALIHSG